MAKSIKDLRQEKGFRSAREFADALGIATSSMSRYDKDPETIPLKHAWAMADLLGCSIDEVVGREPVTAGRNELQEFYDGLLPETRELMDELIEFARMKDEATRRKAKAEEDRRYDELCRFYERLWCVSLRDTAEFGKVRGFSSHAEERGSFEHFLVAEAAKKAEEGMQLHLAGVEDELRGGYIDEDGEPKRFSEEQIQDWLADERRQMEDEQAKRDREVIDKILEAYDRLFGTPAPDFDLIGPKTTIEYASVRLPK